jgi:hypothetical protein
LKEREIEVFGDLEAVLRFELFELQKNIEPVGRRLLQRSGEIVLEAIDVDVGHAGKIYMRASPVFEDAGNFHAGSEITILPAVTVGDG